MPDIAIAYVSGRGHTRRLAEEIAAELGAQECHVRLIDVEVMFKKDWDALDAADAIVMGAPPTWARRQRHSKHSWMRQEIFGRVRDGATSWPRALPWRHFRVGTSYRH